nr:hypothetical protein [Tanacetum cinerariifolium]
STGAAAAAAAADVSEGRSPYIHKETDMRSST